MPFKNPFSQAVARLQSNKQPEIETSDEQKVELKPSILLVDDEPDTLMLIKYSLERAGFDVVTSETAYDAIQKSPRPEAKPGPSRPHVTRNGWIGSFAGISTKFILTCWLSC